MYPRLIGSISFILCLMMVYGPLGTFLTISSVFICFMLDTLIHMEKENNPIVITVSGGN